MFPDSELSLDRAYSHQEVFVGFDFDVLGIPETIAGAVFSSESCYVFVKKLAYILFYRAGAQYNVMALSLNLDHDLRFKGVE